MIKLNKDKNYYIMIDGQGSSFGGGVIYEDLKEVAERFMEWGDSDEMEDLENYTLGSCIEVWVIDIKKYDGREFVDLTEEELDKTLGDLVA